jgi:hypothetical protein
MTRIKMAVVGIDEFLAFIGDSIFSMVLFPGFALTLLRREGNSEKRRERCSAP